MTYTPIPRDTQDWDAPLNAALTDQDTRITSNTTRIGVLEGYSPETANQRGLLSWNGNPVMFANSSAPATGVLQMIKLNIPFAGTVSNILITVITNGSSLTSNQNFAGLYNSSGTLLGQTADQSTNWTSGNLKTMPLTSAVNVTPGDYYVGLLANGTTAPSLLRGLSAANATLVLSINQTAVNASYTTTGSGLTSLPASVTMASRTLASLAFWVALS